MTTFENSPEKDLFGMELELTPSAEGSRVRMQVSPILEDLEAREKERDYSDTRSELLAKWDANTSSWKTSQASFQEDLETFSGRWPKSGSMQNGIVFRHQTYRMTTRVNDYLSLPTPNARDGKDLSKTDAYLAARARHSPSLATTLLTQGVPWFRISMHYELAMGFPLGWSAAVYMDAETPSYPKSPNLSDDP